MKALIPVNVLRILILVLLAVISGCSPGDSDKDVSSEVWLTKLDQSSLLELQDTKPVFKEIKGDGAVIMVSADSIYQEMDGFGFSLTGGSAGLIYSMDPESRQKLLLELFGNQEGGIGVSYLRISIGASDLDEYVFSYNDLPSGQTDPNLDHFSLDPDRRALIPVLQEILEINPKIKLMGSPWSAPVWMKDNQDTRGGSLLKEHYDTYAEYFVKYIKEMTSEGIPLDAITIQNEPLHPGNNPSMFMMAEDQTEFIKDFLGPAFLANKIETKIIVYDHNADRPDYPLTILSDPEAAKFVDGSAFHLYNGKIDALTYVHNAYPDKNLYFTEQWVGAPQDFPREFSWHTRELIIGASRNWCRTVLEWNLAADPDQEPHTDRGGCTRCLGAVTIDGNMFTRNVAYYIIAQASSFVTPGSHRIYSGEPEGLNTVAFRTPSGKIVLIIQNDSPENMEFSILFNDRYLSSSLTKGAVGTYVWRTTAGK